MTLKDLIKVIVEKDMVELVNMGDGVYHLKSDGDNDLIIRTNSQQRVVKIGEIKPNKVIHWLYQE